MPVRLEPATSLVSRAACDPTSFTHMHERVEGLARHLRLWNPILPMIPP